MLRVLLNILIASILCFTVQQDNYIDIWSTYPWPSNALSNLYDWPFSFEGVECGSIEGWLQGIKSPDIEVQKEICAMDGHTAKSHSTAEWKTNQTLYWKDECFGRQSERFYTLLSAAYDSLAAANPAYVEALLATEGKEITHKNGKTDPTDTVLTQEEFCRELTRLRSIYIAKRDSLNMVSGQGREVPAY